MNSKLAKVFSVTDGLASLTHKKIAGLVKELQGEKVLTSEEGKKVLEGLAKVKKSFYDNLSSELKKLLDKKNTAQKAKQKKKKK
jgi:polyhydroxyalkanoate synthesis regulator phasin